jgi:hypothetical protein
MKRVKAAMHYSQKKYRTSVRKRGYYSPTGGGYATIHQPESDPNIVDKYRETVDKVYKLGRNLKKSRISSFWIPPYMGLNPARAGYIRGTFFL